MYTDDPMTRRKFLAAAGASGVALAAAACGSSSSGASNVAKSGAVTVTYGTDSALGPALSPWIKKFNTEFAPLKASLALLSSYVPDVQTRLAAGGSGLDVVFANSGYGQRWYDNHWIQPLDGLPGLAEINSDFNVTSLRGELYASDGKQIAIPYYAGLILFAYNDALLSKVGAAPPTDWDELTTILGELKKAGLSTPYAPYWDKDFGKIVYTFFSHCASDGMTTFFDDSPHNLPVFQNDPIAQETLNRWVSWYKSGYVAADVLASSYTSVFGLFAAGKSAFAEDIPQSIKPWQTVKSNASAGHTKIALMPGKTHYTGSGFAMYYMTASTRHRAEAWQFMQYLAWRDAKDGNQYVVPNGFLLDNFGQPAPWTGDLASATTKAALSSFLDYDVYKQQSSMARAIFFPGDRQPWFAGFLDAFASALQGAIVGQSSVQDALNQGLSYAKAHLNG